MEEGVNQAVQCVEGSDSRRMVRGRGGGIPHRCCEMRMEVGSGARDRWREAVGSRGAERGGGRMRGRSTRWDRERTMVWEGEGAAGGKCGRVEDEHQSPPSITAAGGESKAVLRYNKPTQGEMGSIRHNAGLCAIAQFS